MIAGPVLSETDNPYELIDVVCKSCRERLIESREEVHRRGWVLVRFLYLSREDEFFCPECFEDPEFD